MSKSKKQVSVEEDIIEPIRRESPHIYVTTEEETSGGKVEYVVSELLHYDEITEVDLGSKKKQLNEGNTIDEHSHELFPDVDNEEMIQPVNIRSRPITPIDEIMGQREEVVHLVQPINVAARPITSTKNLFSSEDSVSFLAQQLLQSSENILQELQSQNTSVKLDDSIQDIEEETLQPLDIKIEFERKKMEVKQYLNNRDVEQNVVIASQKKETKPFFVPSRDGNVIDFRRARALENWQKAFYRVQPPLKRMIKLAMNMMALQNISEEGQRDVEAVSPSSHINIDESAILALRLTP